MHLQLTFIVIRHLGRINAPNTRVNPTLPSLRFGNAGYAERYAGIGGQAKGWATAHAREGQWGRLVLAQASAWLMGERGWPSRAARAGLSRRPTSRFGPRVFGGLGSGAAERDVQAERQMRPVGMRLGVSERNED